LTARDVESLPRPSGSSDILLLTLGVRYNHRVNANFLKSTLVSAVVLWVASACAGCGGGAGSYCNEARQCEGGNDADEQACNIREDEGAQLADLRNCSQEYDDFASCVYDNARCNNKAYTPDDQTCADEADRYAKCIQ
jgi:hypothetical protein